MKVLLLNGPNLQLLGSREPEIYGRTTLKEIVERVKTLGIQLGIEIEDFQSNHEGELVTRIGEAPSHGFAGILLNPAAYTHTSVAIRDALAAAALPAVEIHLSNIHGRESFRHQSLTAELCLGVIAGFGPLSYELALRALAAELQKKKREDSVAPYPERKS